MSDQKGTTGKGSAAVGRMDQFQPGEQARLEQLIRFSDLCTSAKEIAEALNDTFLAYMVSMSIQAARLEMRAKIAGHKV